MLVLHHTDNDGYCCAAIAKNYLVYAYDVPAETDFIQYYHGGKNPKDKINREIREGENVYILDLGLDDVIFDFIAYCIEHGAKVTHIDHHKTTKDYMESMSDVQKTIYSNVTQFFETAVSATLLTYAFAMFDDEEKQNPNDVDFGTTSDFSKLLVWARTPRERIYHIPLVVRYVDDFDVWRFALDDTKAFNYGFNTAEYRRKPFTKEWKDLIYGDATIVPKIIERGRIIHEDRMAQYADNMKYAFETTINGVRCLAVNSTAGTSEVFGKRIDDYAMCVLFFYNGFLKKWKYEFRSGERGMDVSTIAKSYGGGGHFHAAGCTSDLLLFDELDMTSTKEI